MSSFIKRNTLKLRHRIAKTIAPSVYTSYQEFESLISRTPRPTIQIAKVYFKDMNNLIGCEIGVASGDNALSILKELPMKRLYLVDPYVPFFVDGRLTSFVSCEEKARKLLFEFPQIRFIKKTSENAVSDITERLDFVYIDGNHTYEYVKTDIKLYYNLIKQNGVIGGHDYTKFYPGVIRATEEFAKDNYLKLYVQTPDWYIIKGETK